MAARVMLGPGRMENKLATAPRVVVLLAALLFLANLWGYDLWAPDEPYFAEGAREMIVDGQWAVPHVNGVVTTDKPPLFFWLIALFSLPLGRVVSITARLPSVLAAIGTLLLVMRLGRRIAEPRTAALAGFVLATSYMFWEKARWTQIDSLLCLLIWVALSAFETFRGGEAGGRSAGLLFWAAAALAVLAKGPVGLLLPLGVALLTLVFDRDLRAWKRFAPLAGPLVFAIVVGAWIVLATVGGHGEYSVWGAFEEHFVQRGLHGMHHRYGWYYYLLVLPPQLLPWTGLVPGALWLAARRRDASDRFLLVAALFVVLFFSISSEKRELYVLPAYPAFALMIARLVGELLGWSAPGQVRLGHRWITAGQGSVGGVLAIAGAALLLAGGKIEEAPYWVAAVVGALLLAVGLLTLVVSLRGRLRAAVLAPASGFAVAYLLTAFLIYPAFEPRKSARPLAVALRTITADSRARGHPVLAYHIGNLPEPLAFYSDGVYTTEAHDRAALIRHLSSPDRVFAVVDARSLDTLPPALRVRLVVEARADLGQEVLLIANRPATGR